VTQEQFFPVGQKFGIWAGSTEVIYASGEGAFRRTSSTGWTEVTTPAPRVVLWSVGGTSPNDVIFAGAFGAVMHWSGSTWKFYDELYDRSSSKSYLRVFAIGNKYFLVGNTPYHALATVGTRESP
jgi:hypothetical protein